jgi:hypothetical protein
MAAPFEVGGDVLSEFTHGETATITNLRGSWPPQITCT